MTAQEYKHRTEELLQQLEQKNDLIVKLTEELKNLLNEVDKLG